jgi:hypothetical protein
MLKVQRLSNVLQKRTIRPIYAQTQATPYATSLDEQTLTGSNAATGRTSFKNSDGSRYLPLSGDTSPLATRTANAFTLKNSLVPGTVMVRTEGERVAVASGVASAAEKPFGLLANFIGGELDDLGENDEIGVWRGAFHAFFELLFPAWNDTGLATALGETANKKGGQVKLYAGADGRLEYVASPGERIAVAEVIERPTASRLLIELLV